MWGWQQHICRGCAWHYAVRCYAVDPSAGSHGQRHGRRRRTCGGAASASDGDQQAIASRARRAASAQKGSMGEARCVCAEGQRGWNGQNTSSTITCITIPTCGFRFPQNGVRCGRSDFCQRAHAWVVNCAAAGRRSRHSVEAARDCDPEWPTSEQPANTSAAA